ncbi:MAG: hypothetical protein V4472_12890 [Pseudomonadota bacterium]
MPMRAKLTYPTKASFHLDEHWPLRSDDLEIQFDVEESRIKAIICIWPLGTDDRPPTMSPLEEGQRGFGKIDFHLVRRTEIEHRVRTIQGLLALHGTIDVDFERPTLEWLADSPEEERGIEIILSGKPPEVDIFKPEKLDFGLVAKAVLGAPHLSKLEVALSFLRRGRRDLKERRYIEAIYNCFFVLETQFAAGLSNPREVAKRLKASTIVTSALEAIRAYPIDPPRGFTTQEELAVWDERVQFLSRSDDEIIDELVKLRGNLHHHAARGPHTWHPDKGTAYRVPAHCLHDIALACAHLIVDAEELDLDADFLAAAEAAGAVTVLRFEAKGLFVSRGAMRLSLDIRTPGTVIDRGMIISADRAFRRAIQKQVEDARLDKYTITHVESGRLYGRYQRSTFAEAATRAP